MGNPRTIREQLAVRLRSISGLTVYDAWPGITNPPCAVVQLADAQPEQVFGRGDLTKWDFAIYVLVSGAGGYDRAQQNLDPYLATSSTGGIFGAIAADRRLASTVSDTFVRGYRDYDAFDAGDGVQYVGAVIDVECWST